MNKFFSALLLLVVISTNAQPDKFSQLYDLLPTPNVYRTAAGAPGHQYYQQKADYKMKISIDDKTQKLTGSESITYTNYSPDQLEYLWVQLDQNVREQGSDRSLIQSKAIAKSKMSFNDIKRLHNSFDGGFKVKKVYNIDGSDLGFVLNKTMMRINLEKPLKSGESFSFSIDWWYNINNRSEIGGRSGYEYFEDEDNYIYTIAQFFPRMAVYNDVEGWQNKQFLGRGEFTLPFGDYDVDITVPSDHVVGASGEIQNVDAVLTSTQQDRFEEAKTADFPVMVVNPKEAKNTEKNKASTSKTWSFKAINVRDFAFASSRKFIWDAVGVKFGDRTVMAMSYYPKEGNPLWEQYSTKVVAHTIRSYSKYTFDYPYPVAISVHTDRIGMEYPMICFNGGRPEADGTYTERTKYGMISVIIHEVGHNFFPMIVNSDERQWTWMDEGLNTFVQYLTEVEWDRDYPVRRGPAYKIVDYMKGDRDFIAPIMTNSESIYQFGNNAYGKPATALNILRETVMGRELFDYSFKTYCQRWMFKHPSPADFFRTMEDASAVDLDWFWRGWFYSTEHVNISIDNVQSYRVDTKDPSIEKPLNKIKDAELDAFVGAYRNKESIPQSLIEKDSELLDFYNKLDKYKVNNVDKEKYKKYTDSLDDQQKSYLNDKFNYYQVDLRNKGGLVMPVILNFVMTDGSEELVRIPAELWIRNEKLVSKLFFFEKEVAEVQLDPFLETADTDIYDNYWPRRIVQSKFELYKQKEKKKNLMQQLGN
jgi:hypothetical protein|tara:strand:+ start:16361 stop:18640 length:2280 start_codon:yes stop_codon:yes gene_type:complete